MAQYQKMGAAKETIETATAANPWFKWAKGNNGKIDMDQAPVTFRFLEVFNDFFMSLSHWVPEIRKAVQCNKTVKRFADGGIRLVGDCRYCQRDKQNKVDWQTKKDNGDASVAKDKYPPRSTLNVNLVARVAVAQKDEEGAIVGQEFRLMPLSAKDYCFSSGKGFYSFLEGFENSRKKLKKPTDLKAYWFTLSLDRRLEIDSLVDKNELKVVPTGFLDEEGKEFDSLNAMPFPYEDAEVLMQQLEAKNQQASSYSDNADVSGNRDMASEDSAKEKKVESTYDDDDEAPFN